VLELNKIGDRRFSQLSKFVLSQLYILDSKTFYARNCKQLAYYLKRIADISGTDFGKIVVGKVICKKKDEASEP